MLDESLRLTLRNFSTLFLLVATVVLPLHLLYGAAFSEVIGLQELAGEIEEAPVGAVSSENVDRARIAFWALTALEVALIPLAARATRRVVEVDRGGGVPTVWDAWRKAFGDRAGARENGPGDRGRALAVAILIGLTAGFLVERIGSLFLPLVPPEVRFTAVALVDAAARGVGAPLLLVVLALSGRARASAPQE